MHSLTVAVLLACVVGLALGNSCPNSCSHHGTCQSTNTCKCTDPWAGYDCSIYNQSATADEMYSESVVARQWKFYNYNSIAGETMVWWMNQSFESLATSDCDLYIRKDELPTLSNFLVRNISMADDLSLVVPVDESGRYYVGVYGYKGCSYHLRLNVQSECPNSCHKHGQCVEGACVCNDNYYGSQCQHEVRAMDPDTDYSATVYYQSWIYYSYTTTQVIDEIDWVLTKRGSSSQDADIYLRGESPPTLWDWDLANITLGTEKVINQTQVGLYTTYYLGVYGYSRDATHYTVKIHVVTPDSPSDCPNSCSHHGTCSNNVCTCSPDYKGEECEERANNDMTFGKYYDGYVGTGAWNYFEVGGDHTNSFIVELKRTSTAGDPDLYVKAGEKPSRFDFDYVNITTGDSMTVTVPASEGTRWWIGVYGYYGSEYEVKVDYTNECLCVEEQHGYCVTGSPACTCYQGWAGEDCETEVVALTSSVPVTNEGVTNGVWKYYSISSEHTSAVSLSVKEKSTKGMVWIFVRHNEPPTLNNYDFSDKDSHNPLHQISYGTKTPQSGTLFIGVYGSPFLPEVTIDGTGTIAYYDLSCWASDF